jgi:hypothetical protein
MKIDGEGKGGSGTYRKGEGEEIPGRQLRRLVGSVAQARGNEGSSIGKRELR